jgi:cell volume regulation protein A
MADSYGYGGLLLLIGVVGVLAVLTSRITQRIPVPAPALLLAGTAIAVQLLPDLRRPPARSVDHLVTVTLILILFDGGRQLGWSRFRRSARPIALTGVAGTFLTTAGAALVLHLLGLPWYPALLVATAVAPTDPAVVFSVLGQRELAGASGTILQGESGANDPVGIALMASLLSAGELSGSSLASAAGQFVLQLVVGALVGVLGGRLLLSFTERVPLPTGALYPVRTLAGCFVLFGIATLAHGSGFLAVFIAGILFGDARLAYQREVEHVHAAAASLGEIVAFVALGMTVDLGQLGRSDVWLPALVLAVLLTVLIRPLLVGGCLIGSGLARNERALVLLAGLKGAVPILLGTFLLDSAVADAERLYAIVVLVVIFSVAVQASSLPALASALKVPMRAIRPEPWAFGVRLRNQPDDAHRLTVAAGSAADGRTVGQLLTLPQTAWISFLVRNGTLLRVSADTELQAGDQVLVLAEPDQAEALAALFDRG